MNLKQLIQKDNVALLELINQHPRIITLINKLQASGVFNIATDLEINKSDSESYTEIIEDIDRNYYRISLGDKEIPDRILEQIRYKHFEFTKDQSRVYRLLHELVHIALCELQKTDKGVQDLMWALTTQAKATNTFYTAIAGFEYEKGSKPAAEEDLTELVTMYLWKRTYFEEYMDFLSDKSSKDKKFDEYKSKTIDKLHLKSLNSQEIEFLVNLIEVLSRVILS